MRLLGMILSASSVWTWIHRLGGPGLIILGLIDNSMIPLPGSVDVFVVLLAAHHRPWWPYYAVMATAGAVLGGYVTYRLAEKGGQETLEKEIGTNRAQKAYKRFERRGFSTVMIGAVMPPPFPLVPVLMAAGVMQYPRKKFLSALSIGRAIRFFALAFLARVYGTAIFGWLNQYYKPLLYTLIALASLGAIYALLYFKWYRPKRQRECQEPKKKVAVLPMPPKKPEEQDRNRRVHG
jgi:membrane protein YqaA with SNARE-associated domain